MAEEALEPEGKEVASTARGVNEGPEAGEAGDVGGRPVLVLHVCCGPCATVALERLVGRFRVLAYWYNPNLWPAEEYERRLEDARRACGHFGVELVEGPADFEAWREAVRGLEDEPEGGRRCDVCIAWRLRKVAQWAAEKQAEWLTTTLTVGPQKKVERIHQIGRKIAEAHGIQWLAETFRKRGGFQRSVEISRELGLYRQDYCGCEFSFRERQAREVERASQ